MSRKNSEPYVFEELIRKFNEENNEEAGEHLPENTLENVRYSMENGTFYATALISKRELGLDFVASGPAPKITDITVDQDENAITITGENYTTIEWIADDEIIATGNTVDLNDYEDKVDSYIRAQLKGAGGISFTQPFGIYNAPDEQIISLTESIESLDLNKGIKNSLTAKLDNALKSVGGDKNNSVNILNAFINEVNSLSDEGGMEGRGHNIFCLHRAGKPLPLLEGASLQVFQDQDGFSMVKWHYGKVSLWYRPMEGINRL